MRRIDLFLFLLALSTHAQYWQPAGDFPGTARDDAAAFAIGTHAYFGTGMETGWALTSNWWMMDIVGWPQWYPVPDLPGVARQYATGFGINERGYVFGGLATGGPLNELWSFSETDNMWTERSPLPGPGRYACSAFVVEGDAYVVGGLFADGTPTPECWRYEPSQDIWTQVSDLPGLARHRASSFSVGSLGYLVGGADQSYNALSEMWRYAPTTDEWTEMAPLPQPRYGSASLSNVAFGIVGGASNDSTFHANSYIYDLSANTWSEMIDTLPYGLRGASSAYAEGGGGWYFNVIGTGLDNDLVRRREMYLYGYVFSIDELALTPIRLYPNPACTTIYVAFPSNWAESTFNIHDGLGRILMTGRSMNTQPIHISELPAGHYDLWLEFGAERLRASFIKLP
jgi:N-acetylneuraminic acid mutarotase